MNKADDYINIFAEMFANIFDADIEVVKLDASKLANKFRAKKFKEIIVDAENALDEINNNQDMDVQEKIKSLTLIMFNASVVDAYDMKTLTQKEAKNYYDLIKIARNKFDNITRDIQINICNLKNDMLHPKEDEDLTKLSKEELIELLRRK